MLLTILSLIALLLNGQKGGHHCSNNANHYRQDDNQPIATKFFFITYIQLIFIGKIINELGER